MADISMLNINGTTYNIKDTVARANSSSGGSGGSANQPFAVAEDYGIKGDGSTDDTSALQSALNSGKYVKLKPGKYIISNTLIIPKNVTLDLGADEGYKDEKTGNTCAEICINENVTAIEMREGSKLLGGTVRQYLGSTDYTASLIYIDASNYQQYQTSIYRTSLYGTYKATAPRVGTAITIDTSKAGTNSAGEGFCVGSVFDVDMQHFHTGLHTTTQYGENWCTNIYHRGYSSHCDQIVDLQGGGVMWLSGVYQTCNMGGDTTPLLNINAEDVTIDGFIWDVGQGTNHKYAIHLGEHSNRTVIAEHIAKIYPIQSPYIIDEGTNFEQYKKGQFIIPSVGQTNCHGMLGQLDNCLVGAHLKYTVTGKRVVSGTTYNLSASELAPLFQMKYAGGYFDIPGNNDYLEIEIDFGQNMKITHMGVNFQDTQIPKSMVVSKYMNGAWVDIPVVQHYKTSGGSVQNSWFHKQEVSWEDEVGGVSLNGSVTRIKFKMIGSQGGGALSIENIWAKAINTGNENAFVPVYGGDVYGDINMESGTGIVLKDSNGNSWRLTVNTSGAVSATRI